MSNFSISSLFPFRRAKIDGFEQIVDPDKGIVLLSLQQLALIKDILLFVINVAARLVVSMIMIKEL